MQKQDGVFFSWVDVNIHKDKLNSFVNKADAAIPRQCGYYHCPNDPRKRPANSRTTGGLTF